MARPRILGFALVLGLVCAVSAHAQPQSSAQQGCINALNKAGAKVAAAQAKENAACLKRAGAGDEPAAQACLMADLKAKVARAQAATATAETKKCATAPDFGAAGAVAVNDVARDEEVGLVADVFGADLGAAAILAASDKVGAGCQLAVAKATEKVLAAKLKRFLACEKSGLKAGTIVSPAGLEGCFGVVAADAGVAKAVGKLAGTIAKKCVGVPSATAFPGACAAAGDLPGCLDARVECRACRMLNAMDLISYDCDLFDDGADNATCFSPPVGDPTPTATPTAATPTPTATPTCGATLFADDFAGTNGDPWPLPWTELGSVDVADLQGGRGRFRPTLSGYSLARLGVDLDAVDVEARMTIEFEDIAQQGIGFYVRQNGGYLGQTMPVGQGYAVFVEGFRGFQGIGVWREVSGSEEQLLIDMGQTIADGVRYRVRFQVEQTGPGTTTLRAKMWPEAGMEPAGWDVETTDVTPALQNVAGGIAADSWSEITTGGPTPEHTFIDDIEIVPLCD